MSDSAVERLRLGWIDLEASSRGRSGEATAVQRLVLGGASLGAIVRLSLQDGCRGILLEGHFADTVAEHATRSVYIGPQIREVDGRNISLMHVRCMLPRLNEVFALLAGSIIARLEDGDSPSAAVVRALEEFRELLRADGAPSLSDDEALGLFGELSLLARAHSEDSTALAYWTGPLQNRRDFRGPHGSIEVKATRRRDFSAIEISTIDQLQCDPPERLHLYVVSVEDSVLGKSIPQVVDELLAAGIRSDAFWALLTAAGYREEMRLQLAEHRYGICEERFYAIDPGFPCLTPDSFVGRSAPVGVRDIRYSIDLSHAETFRVPFEHHERLIRSFARGADRAS